MNAWMIEANEIIMQNMIEERDRECDKENSKERGERWKNWVLERLDRLIYYPVWIYQFE